MEEANEGESQRKVGYCGFILMESGADNSVEQETDTVTKENE